MLRLLLRGLIGCGWIGVGFYLGFIFSERASSSQVTPVRQVIEWGETVLAQAWSSLLQMVRQLWN